MKTVKFRNQILNVSIVEYHNNKRPAIVLLDKNGESYCTASVNLSDEILPPGHVFIKNWSENEGVLEALVEGGIVEDTGLRFHTGFTYANLVKLVDQDLKKFHEEGEAILDYLENTKQLPTLNSSDAINVENEEQWADYIRRQEQRVNDAHNIGYPTEML